METIVIDGQSMTSREAVHDRLAVCLDLPEHYGRNLDALYDCLTERALPARLEVRHTAELEASLWTDAQALRETLEDAARSNPVLVVAWGGAPSPGQ